VLSHLTKLTEETKQHADKYSMHIQSERQHNEVSKEKLVTVARDLQQPGVMA